MPASVEKQLLVQFRQNHPGRGIGAATALLRGRWTVRPPLSLGDLILQENRSASVFSRGGGDKGGMEDKLSACPRLLGHPFPDPLAMGTGFSWLFFFLCLFGNSSLQSTACLEHMRGNKDTWELTSCSSERAWSC